jgi:hypothetical protein
MSDINSVVLNSIVKQKGVANMFSELIKSFINDESGKGLTDYGTMLVFAAIVVSLFFGMKGAAQATNANAFAPINN